MDPNNVLDVHTDSNKLSHPDRRYKQPYCRLPLFNRYKISTFRFSFV